MDLNEILSVLAWLFGNGCADCRKRAQTPVIDRKGEITFLCVRHAMDYVCPVKFGKLPSKLPNKLKDVKLPDKLLK